MLSDSDDDGKHQPEKMERFCPSLKISKEFVTQRRAKVKRFTNSEIGTDDEYFGDGCSQSESVSESESESDSDEDDVKVDDARYSGKLDKWDKAARSWLSSGTMFFLIVLFHILQVRSDLRRFTTAANNQLQEACSILEDKSVSLQTALGLAAHDVGPITFKFVRDLKTKTRSAFLFAGQIFGSKVRSMLSAVFQQYYCLLVGILVTIISFKDIVITMINFLPRSDSFVHDLAESITDVITKIMEFMVEPEKFFNEAISKLLDIIFDHILAVDLPFVNCEKMKQLCSNKSDFNFDGIHNLLRSYLTKMIAITAILLIVYNTVIFIRTIRLHERELKESEADSEKLHLETISDCQYDDESENESIGTIRTTTASAIDTLSSNSSASSNGSYYDSDGCIVNAGRWLFNFFSYEPFLLFICMGIFGICHAYFSSYLRQQARQIKLTIIDPEIDKLKDSFIEMMQEYVTDLEIAWRGSFSTLLKPLETFITSLTNNFKPILDFVITIGKNILGFIDNVIEALKSIVMGDVISQTVSAVLDCLFLKHFRFWIKIADMIRECLFGNKWKQLTGGVAVLLKNSIDAIFKKLQLTKYLKKMFSVTFFLFMRMVARRSIFLYVYLIVCALLISQGIFMIFVKFVLGYF